jgi:hypothetical protein
MAETALPLDISGVGAVPVSEHMTLPEIPKIKEKSEFEALEPGSKYLDPEGKPRVKPYSPKTAVEFSDVPEGAQYLDPDNKLREKPTYEGIDVTTQTLYDMAVNEKEQRRALERGYKGKVKEGPEGLYIEDDGKLRKPGRGISSIVGGVGAATVPVGATVLGAVGGGLPGAVGGALLGQTFNDTVLQLAGIYDRSLTEEASAMGMAGASALIGTGVGRGVAAVAPAAKAAISKGSAGLPTFASYFLGAKPESMKMARELADKGVMVPPSSWAHESPHLQNVAEVFDPAFRTDKPMQKSSTDYYEREKSRILDDLGVSRPTTEAERAAVPIQTTGERILQRTLAESASADQELQRVLDQRLEASRSRLTENIAQRESIAAAAERSQAAAQKLIDQGFKDIESDTASAFKVANANGNTGVLWENIGNKLTALRRGISERARYWYDRYDQMTSGHTVSSESLSEPAQRMLDELPAEFKSRNPSLVQKLAKLAGEKEDVEISRFGGPAYSPEIKASEQLTYGQLHDLRSLFRGSADWHTLSSDFKNGALKNFSGRIDALLHDPAAPDAVKQAGKFLDMVDKWYGHNISIFEAQQIKAVMKGLQAGEPADPRNLYNVLIKEGHTDLIRRVRDMVGPNLWSGVRAADTQAMMDASKSLQPGVIDGRKFVREVLDRHRANLLETVHGKEASENLLAQARAIEQLDGRLPIPAKPSDTLTQVISRARMAADEAQAAAKRDPLGTLKREMSEIQGEHRLELSRLKAERKSEPLGFLHNPTVGASEAVEKILGSEDLILAASAKFGEKSEEFNMLRQIYAQRVLEGGLNLGRRLEKITPEIQQLMFPGVTLKQMQTLAKEMEFLTERRGLGKTTAGSMSAMAKVEHPVGGRIIGQVTGKIPGVNIAGRAVLGAYYKFVTKLATSPGLLRWIEKGLTEGAPKEKEAIRALIRQAMNRGGSIGAGIGELGEQQMRGAYQ